MTCFFVGGEDVVKKQSGTIA